MKASNPLWKARLAGRIESHLAAEIDVFENEIALKKHGKIEDKIFAETRLRRGAYGQRYDNGLRHDGVERRTLPYPEGLTKGPGTVWDAPGMQRIKIPFGGVNAEQLEVLAELAEEYSDGIAHVTTRQDFQLHYIHIEDTPALMRRLAAVGITTREACGNTVRNVTACPLAGVCRDQAFDVTPYAEALTYFLLGHPDTQEFGRKFKVGILGLRNESVRAGPNPRSRPHRPRARWRAGLRRLRRRRAGYGPVSGEVVRPSSCRKQSCCRWRKRWRESSPGSARRRTAIRRESSSWW